MKSRFPLLTARPARSALLWDLDNVNPGYRHMQTLARALLRLVEPQATRIAAGHRSLYRACRGPLAEVHIGVVNGGRGTNGADRTLLFYARMLKRSGVERFVVASADGTFAHIGDFGELHVVTLAGAPVSERLHAKAHSVVTLLPTDQGWWQARPDRCQLAFGVHAPPTPEGRAPPAVAVAS
jgi:hypothetical protein